MEKKSKFAFAAAAGAVSLYALAAFAQQQNNQSAQPSAPPAASAPSTAAPGAPAVSEPKNDTTAKPDSDDSGDGRGRGWRRRMGQGPDAGYAGPGMRGQGMQRGRMGQRWRNMSEADRKAFFEARIAAIRAGLMLNETQQRLWPAVEDAVRDMYAKRQAMAERIRKEGRPANPVDRMKRRGDMMAERGAALQKFANAARPLYDTLSDEQKRRLRMLTPGMQRMNRMRSNWRHGGMRGNRMQGHHGHHGRRFGQHHHNWGGRDHAGPQRWQRQGQYRQNWQNWREGRQPGGWGRDGGDSRQRRFGEGGDPGANQGRYGQNQYDRNQYGQNQYDYGRRWRQSYGEPQNEGFDRGAGMADWTNL